MPSFLKPAISARHRQACLALYKSLLTQATSVPLPPDILSLSSSLSTENPIKTLIRNTFKRNRGDTSPRLVVSSLKNGYRFLSLLSTASISSTSKEYSDICNFLRENTERVIRIKTAREKELAERPKLGPREGHVPIITKVSGEGEPPVYKPTRDSARPLSEIPNGIRKVPRLDLTGLVPFLRLYKPMSRFHERVVRQISRKRSDRVRLLLEMQEDDLVIARMEDEWERQLGFLAKKEGRYKQFMREEKEGVLEELSFERTMKHAIKALMGLLEEERVDLVARGEAMFQIEKREQEALDRELEEKRKREGLIDEEDIKRFRRWKEGKERKGREILKVMGEKESQLRRGVERLEREEEEELERRGIVVEK